MTLLKIMQVQPQLTEILQAVASAALSFLAGIGIYLGVQNLSSSVQPQFRPSIETVQPNQQTQTTKPEPAPKPRPVLGDSCPPCGRG